MHNIDQYKFKNYRKEKQVKEVIGFTWSPDETKFSDSVVYCLIDDICRDSAYYTFYPEYRDVEAKLGRHYHGVLYIFDKVKWFKRSKPMWEMMNVIKPHWEFGISEHWHTYIEKQHEVQYTNYPGETVQLPSPLDINT